MVHNHDHRYELVYGYMADGMFKKIISYFKRDFETLSHEEIKFIYSTFVAKESHIETQISIHSNNVLNKYLSNGETIEVG